MVREFERCGRQTLLDFVMNPDALSTETLILAITRSVLAIEEMMIEEAGQEKLPLSLPYSTS